MEYLITDRMSFRWFLGIMYSDKAPDSKTVWKFRESLVEAGAVESLFDRFR